MYVCVSLIPRPSHLSVCHVQWHTYTCGGMAHSRKNSKWVHYGLQIRTVEWLSVQHQTVLAMFLGFRKPLYSRTEGMCHFSTHPSGSLHVTQFYQAFPCIRTASDKHWGEKAWVRNYVCVPLPQSNFLWNLYTAVFSEQGLIHDNRGEMVCMLSALLLGRSGKRFPNLSVLKCLEVISVSWSVVNLLYTSGHLDLEQKTEKSLASGGFLMTSGSFELETYTFLNDAIGEISTRTWTPNIFVVLPLWESCKEGSNWVWGGVRVGGIHSVLSPSVQ